MINPRSGLIYKKILLFRFQKKNIVHHKNCSLFIFSTSRQPPQSTPSSPESRLGIPNSHQNPRQLSATSTAIDRIFSYSRPLSTPSTNLQSSHHFAPPVNSHSASTTNLLVTTTTTSHLPHPSSPTIELHCRRQ